MRSPKREPLDVSAAETPPSFDVVVFTVSEVPVDVPQSGESTGRPQATHQTTWADTFARLYAARSTGALEADDLEQLATAAYLIGRYSESVEIRTRAHTEHLAREDVEGAARCAFWLGFQMLFSGERARGGGWLARAGRLLETGGHESAVSGFLQLPAALAALGAGDLEKADAAFAAAVDAGATFGEPDLIALGRLGEGQVRIRRGNIEGGVQLLDEAMTAAETGELSPMATGVLYCAVLEACQEIFDVSRAAEWTGVMSAWCDAEPGLVPFRGQCLVRRSEILQLKGEWTVALEEVLRAGELLSRPPGDPAIAAALYQQGELHRLRGEFAAAGNAFDQAAGRSSSVQPGLALLRLAEGRADVAEAGIRRALGEAQDPLTRARLLPACVEIMLAVDDLAGATTAADELGDIARSLRSAYLAAAAEHAAGSIAWVSGESEAALTALRGAVRAFEDIPAHYEAARARELVGLACRTLADEEAARMEFAASRTAFERLGAAPDLRRVTSHIDDGTPEDARGLSRRELEVLRLVASGETNRAIGQALSISERTVERHVSNIFRKLTVSTRAAATAFAYEHGLV